MDTSIKGFTPAVTTTTQHEAEKQDTFKPAVDFQAVAAVMNSMPSVEAWSQGEGV